MFFRPIYTVKVVLRFIADVVFVLPVRDALFAPYKVRLFIITRRVRCTYLGARNLVTRVTLSSSERIKGLRHASIIGRSHPVKAAHRKVAINYSVYQARELTVIQNARF